jgi:SAM-dependent methyltransferase
MSIASDSDRTYARPVRANFGAGGLEPYASALRRGMAEVLYLQELRHDREPKSVELDLARWSADADRIDYQLLASVRGPVLDVGCGPARMVRAARDLGMDALGIDVSLAAVEIARAGGVEVLHASIFDPLPSEGAWQTVLLVDENIGIGGDATALLARCRELISVDGEIVVELHPDFNRDRTYTGRLVDAQGAVSATFPWAELGLKGLLKRSARVGLRPRQSWSAGGRNFCRLAKSLT